MTLNIINMEGLMINVIVSEIVVAIAVVFAAEEVATAGDGVGVVLEAMIRIMVVNEEVLVVIGAGGVVSAVVVVEVTEEVFASLGEAKAGVVVVVLAVVVVAEDVVAAVLVIGVDVEVAVVSTKALAVDQGKIKKLHLMIRYLN
uniref:Putative product n=1 Tax=Xenopsylla cheopis TaxID=163159 RepID=A0A6M2E2B8_XENCH